MVFEKLWKIEVRAFSHTTRFAGRSRSVYSTKGNLLVGMGRGFDDVRLSYSDCFSVLHKLEANHGAPLATGVLTGIEIDDGCRAFAP